MMCRLRNNNNTPSVCLCPIVPRKHSHVHESLLISLAFMILPFLPATNLLFYVGFVVAERVLYLPSVGYCFLLALGFNVVYNKLNKRVSFVFFSLLVMTHTARTLQRNEDWRDEESLYRSGIAVNPPKAYANLGSILSSQGRLEEAEKAFRLALLHRPNMADVHYNLGNLQAGLKRYPEAVQSYETAIRFRPSLAVAYLNLGYLLASLGRNTEAEKVLLKCSKLESSGLKDVNAHKNAQSLALLHLSRLYYEKGNFQEAVEVYREAVSIRSHLDMSETENGLLLNPKYEVGTVTGLDPSSAYLTLGKFLMKNRTKASEVTHWFHRAPLTTLKDPVIYMNYGKFLVDAGRYKEAVNVYLEATKLGVDQYNVVTSAATILREAGKYDEAEIFYRKALSIKPNDATSCGNLGAILHIKGNREVESIYKGAESNYKEAESYYREAESFYKEALKLNPRDETALVNLRKLKNWMKRSVI